MDNGKKNPKDPTWVCITTSIYYSTEMPKTYTGEKTASSTNGAGKTWCPHVEERSQTCVSSLSQNLTPNTSKN